MNAEDVMRQYFAQRSAALRGVVPRDAVRPWTPGTHPDVDSGRAHSTQRGDVSPVELISVRQPGPGTTGRASARFRDQHARWQTTRRD